MPKYINPENIKLTSTTWIDGGQDILVPLIEVKKAIAQTPSENVVVLPCKIGDTVYIIDEAGDGECSDDYVLDVKVSQFFINENGIAVDLKLPLGMRLNTWMVVGKNVFLTEEEAEKALAERSRNERN